jgi:hypothetical protein
MLPSVLLQGLSDEEELHRNKNQNLEIRNRQSDGSKNIGSSY